ncbi:transglycosylase SLT domain-containing protein [Oligoflexus tunisiensis]|uniref:lytic transglycosylase domain-containing protein n=1 Tax=Oligoflexus tunisiensis TaxID=708132 RepID=UPI00159F0033|nr:transglycosylase SLT domain-containing protein [Oligoflexus tunisiensis]
MLRALRCLVSLGLFQFVSYSDSAEAPTPPETHVLREHKKGIAQADPSLEIWLHKIYEGRSPLGITGDKEFEAALQSWDPASAWLFRLRRTEGSNDKTVAKGALAQALDSDSQLANEPMYPYVLQALAEHPGLDAKERAQARDLLLERGGISCPRKKTILQDLRAQDKGSLTADSARRYLTTVQEFNALGFVEEGLRALVYGISPATQKEMRAELASALQPFPRLVSDNPDLFEENPEVPDTRTAVGPILQAEKQAGNGDCTAARNSLIRGMKEDTEKQNLLIVETVAGKIDSCLKPKGDRARIASWQELEAPLKDAYGFPGAALAQRRLGLIHWGRDEFDDARRIFSQMLLLSEKEYPEIHADTLFTYARVVENEGRFDEAIEKYRFFIELYPTAEQSNQALSSMIVLATLLKRGDDALRFALQMIDLEAVKPVDDRDGASLPMALYWAGKLYLEKGDHARAEFFWARLAQEFYSTFYGALGHYSLERLTRKRFMLPPVHSPQFNKGEMYKEFPLAERKVLQRAERLLLAGMKDDAACEIKEIRVESNDTHRQLAKALFQFAAGDWLAAIRIYQNLPKSYRLTLPRGMERVLFPRAFSNYVTHYAKKMKVDPAYVNAIIRQESVFNPRARSAVGARGLMQLMPGTAKMEARAVRGDYVGEAEKLARVNRVLNDESLLSEPEVNITLGVQHVHRLFQKYRSPVFVLTSYNANPRATERWLESIDSSDMIVFIERIPYRETRSYVKLVMRNYFYYKRWYEGVDVAMPLMDVLLPQALAADAKVPYQATSNP